MPAHSDAATGTVRRAHRAVQWNGSLLASRLGRRLCDRPTLAINTSPGDRDHAEMTLRQPRTERSLYHRANGYNYEVVKIFMPANRAKPVYAPYIEHVPPDVTGVYFFG